MAATAVHDQTLTGEFRRASSLADTFDPRANSLNALRLLLASAVLVSHSWRFVYGEVDPLGRLTGGIEIGGVAVDGFFLLSGFLIVRSQLRAPSTGRYLWHRFLRILPGFWVCLVTTAVVFAPLLWWLERNRIDGYPWTGSDSALTYVVANVGLRMNQFNIGDVRGGQALDGSLHTLFFEFLCYLMIAALGALGILRHRRVVVLAGACGFTLLAAVDAVGGGERLSGTYTVRFAGIFLVGSVMYLYAERIPLSRWLVPPALALLVVAAAVPATYLVFAPAALGYLLLYAATCARFARVGAERDLSYGIYIYAWPIQLVLLEVGVGHAGLVAYVVAALALSAFAAGLSWRFVESQAMSHKARPLPAKLRRSSVKAPLRHPDTTSSL